MSSRALNRNPLPLLAFLLWTTWGWSSALQKTQGQDDAAKVTDAEDAARLERLVQQLGDPSYQRRQVAMRHLVAAGEAAIPFLERAVLAGDLELVDRANSILQDLATLETPKDSGDAWAALTRLQQKGPGAAASRATSAKETIQNERTERAQARLNAAGITSGFQSLTFATAPIVADMVYFPGDWTLDTEALTWLPWLYTTNTAVVEGKSLNEDVLQALSLMPSLTKLQLIDGDLSAKALSHLAKLKRIDTLEILFVTLGKEDDDLFALAELPLRQRLILTGTAFDQEDVDALKTQFNGLEIAFGRGGFLGVQCLPSGLTCEVDLVVPGSAADRAGLMPGDVITQLGSHPIRRFTDLQENVRKYPPDQEMDLNILRGGKERTLKVSLGRQSGPSRTGR